MREHLEIVEAAWCTRRPSCSRSWRPGWSGTRLPRRRTPPRAWEGGVGFREAIGSDPDASRLDGASLDALFDPTRSLANLGGVFERLEKLPVETE